MLRPIASRLSTVTSTGVVPARNASAVIGPPTKRISTVEKYTLAGAMMVGFVAVPAYILANLKYYKATKA